MQSVIPRKIARVVLSLLFLCGLYVRGVDLGTHFSHLDDIGVSKTILFYKEAPPPEGGATSESTGFWKNFRHELYRMTAIPRMWTYAPLQFFGTYFLISKDEPYREIILGARVPSFLFGMGGLALLILFYGIFDRWRTPAVFIGFTLLAFSWENIIYAKHAASYSVGVFAATALLVLLVWNFRNRPAAKGRMFLSVIILALLSYTQYQVLFLVPAFFFTILTGDVIRNRRTRGSRILLWISLACVYAGLILPLVFLFLFKHVNAGVNHWNVGASGEYRFDLGPGAPLWENFAGGLLFFLRNFFEVFSFDLAFVPEDSPFSLPLGLFLFALFLSGVFSYARTRLFSKRMLGLFLLSVALTWSGLIVTHKLALSPTRHNLILLPFLCLVVAEGWRYALSGLRPAGFKKGMTAFGHWIFTAALLFLFFAYFPGIVASRRDPFDEKRMNEIMQKYGVDTLVSMDWTWNPSVMGLLTRNRHYFEDGFMRHVFRWDGASPLYRNVAYVSNRHPLTYESFREVSGEINLYHFQTSGMPLNDFFEKRKYLLFPENLSDYRILYSAELPSDVEVDFSKKIKYGSNNYYFYILQKRPGASRSAGD